MGLLVITALVGICIGLLSGLLGIGGGSVMVPLFRLGFGMTAIQATATSLLAIIPTSAAGCVTHLRNRTCVPAVGLTAGLAGCLTSPLGVMAASASPSWAIMSATAAVIAYSSISMLRKARAAGATKHATVAADARPRTDCTGGDPSLALRMTTGEAAGAADTQPAGSIAATGAPVAASATPAPADEIAPSPFPHVRATRRQLIIGALSGLVAGALSGYVGLGGGFLMVPLFVGPGRLPMKRASGTSLIAITILAIPGVAMQTALGNAQWTVGLAIATGAIPGAVLGANLMKRVPERSLRLMFGVFLLIVAAWLAANEIIFGL